MIEIIGTLCIKGVEKIGQFFDWIFDKIAGNEKKAIGWFVIMTTVLITISIILAIYSAKECEEKGGKIETHTSTTVIFVDGSAVPATTTSSECVVE